MGKLVNLECVRFVRQVTNGRSCSKYGYQAMQSELLIKLQGAQWRQSTASIGNVSCTVNSVTATDGNFSTYLDDKYDAYKQAGDGVSAQASMCGYAGCVAYRFKLPNDFINGTASLSRVSIPCAVDRYNRSGVRCAIVFNEDANPSEEWATIRGESAGAIATSSVDVSGASGISRIGFLGSDAPDVVANAARSGSAEFDLSSRNDTKHTYMWVYLSLEDYEDFWAYYKGTTARAYYIEGSAVLVASAVEVEFSEQVERDGLGWVGMNPALMPGAMFDDDIQSNAGSGDSTFTPCAQATRDSYAKLGRAFTLCTWCAQAFVMAVRDSEPEQTSGVRGRSLGALLRFNDMPRSDLFEHAGDINVESAVDRVPFADMAKFAGMRVADPVWDESAGLYMVDNVADWSVSAFLQSHSGRTSGLMPDGVVFPAKLTFRVRPAIVPAGRASYNRIRYVVEVGSGSMSGMTAGVNVWRANTTDALGPFGGAVVQALCTHQELYSDKGTRFRAELKGDGTETQGVSVSAEAEYIGYVPIAHSVGTQVVDVGLLSPVRPGEMIVFAPHIETVGRVNSACAVMTPKAISIS